MPVFQRKHDAPGQSPQVPATERKTTLEEIIDLCSKHPPGERLHAAGSHWALSDAAISDHTQIECHDPATDANPPFARTLHDVIPGCMHPDMLKRMADKTVPSFDANDGSTVPYFVHVEAGKRIYQLYAELDQPAEDDPDG